MPDTTDEGKIYFISPQLLKKLDYQTPISKFYASATYMSRRTEPESLDFALGDAHEMPPPGFNELVLIGLDSDTHNDIVEVFISATP